MIRIITPGVKLPKKIKKCTCCSCLFECDYSDVTITNVGSLVTSIVKCPCCGQGVDWD